MSRCYLPALFTLLLLVVPLELRSEPVVVSPLGTGQPWNRLEFRLRNLPAALNPYDPDLIRVDAEIQAPSGRVQTIPAFWYQAYTRTVANDKEQLAVLDAPEWRLRFLPVETGDHQFLLRIATNNGPALPYATTNFSVTGAMPAKPTRFAQLATNNTQYFQTSDGNPLQLIGANVCWHGSRGTLDYNDWFPGMAGAGENFARLWMWPHAFGIEADANTLTRYRQDTAWKLDYVFRLAETRGIYLMLCLDYHGMFEVTPDYWGGNNYWPKHPYNSVNGGPCANQNAFFTNTAAQVLYQKRLRYLVARYGYSPNLFAWEFFNELDNVYKYFKPADVVSWHRTMGQWLRTNDPNRHLVTTSMTGGSDRPDIWQLPEMDFAQFHDYNNVAPARKLNDVAQSFLKRYGKPVLIGEFGLDFRGWQREKDPYLRGFRQGLWGGALGGSAGSGMSWWWENLHSENVYPYYAAMGAILRRTGWARSTFTNLLFLTSGSPPVTVGDLLPDGTAFNLQLPLDGGWGTSVGGKLAVPNAAAAAQSAQALNSFIHGSSHADLRRPFQLSCWLTNNARLVMHVNSVSSGSSLVVRADGVQLFRTNLPNRDNYWQVTNEYNLDISVALPTGRRLIEITNTGADWVYLDWVRLEQVLPAQYSQNWKPSPAALGIRGPNESLLYVINPEGVSPGGLTNQILSPVRNAVVTLSNAPGGRCFAEWYDPSTGTNMGKTTATSTNGLLALPLPEIREDAVGILYGEPELRAQGWEQGGFRIELRSETGGIYNVESSTNMLFWLPVQTVTNDKGTTVIYDLSPESRFRFYRARHEPPQG